MKLVVNIRTSEHDVYIGRTEEKFHYGNPFSHRPGIRVIRVLDRGEAVSSYRDWLLGRKHHNVEPERRLWILDHLIELKGKRLGCYCAPAACHGDVLLEMIELAELGDYDWDTSKLKGDMPVPKPYIKEYPQDRDGRVNMMLPPLHAFTIACSACSLGRKPCEERYTTFDPHVFSTMTTSRWMIVGQNPGYNECIQREPFVGDAGKIFDKAIEGFGFKRSDFYISNIVKCHTLNNEKPGFEEISRCEAILRLEMLVVRPILVITLGAVAFGAFHPKLTFGDHLGKIVRSEKFGVNVYPIYHPSPRNLSDQARKKQFHSDIENLCLLIKAYKNR